MRDEIAGLEFPDQAHIEGLFFGKPGAQFEGVEALEDLVVGEAGNFQVLVDKAAGERRFHRIPLDVGFQFLENGLEPGELLGVVRTDIDLIPAVAQFVQRADEQVEVFVEGGLGPGVKGDGRGCAGDSGRRGLGHGSCLTGQR